MPTKGEQMTTESSQDAAEFQEQFLKLGEELRQRTAECDKLRADIAGLLAELIEERQQRIEANARLLATARALGLDDSEVDELPQKAAAILAEGSAACQEWDERCKKLKWDYDKAMRQYDKAQKRAREAERLRQRLQKLEAIAGAAMRLEQEGIFHLAHQALVGWADALRKAGEEERLAEVLKAWEELGDFSAWLSIQEERMRDERE